MTDGGNSEKYGKRRASLAQKMTTNLRRLSGAGDLKIDITEPSPQTNPKFCNKKIKVINVYLTFFIYFFALFLIKNHITFLSPLIILIQKLNVGIIQKRCKFPQRTKIKYC